MNKLLRNMRKKLLSQGRLSKYLAYALGEIFLVMVGILLAFQVNSWSIQQAETKAEQTSYTNIKRQINEDRNVIIRNMDYNKLYLNQYEFATQIIEENKRNQLDTLGFIALNLTKYSDVNRNSNIYQNLVNSGELRLLRNKEVVERLQRLEETYAYMNRMEKIHLDVILSEAAPDLQMIMKLSDKSVQVPNKLYGYEFQNHFFLMIGIMQEKTEIYSQAIEEIKIITELIKPELNQ